MTAQLLAPPWRHILRGETGWPAPLEHLDTEPVELWLLGPAQPAWPGVAVVGARDATVGGLDVSRRLGADLARAGITVISGMALGIDGAAHEGALEAGGTTVAVLGCGVDVCYPSRHRSLRDRIAATGLLLSEDPPGTPADAWRFPRRNRIIAALAAAVVVVEASRRSGALSTARHAMELGREVLAVPGSPLSERSAGTNALIRDGATPLLETADLSGVEVLRPNIARLRDPELSLDRFPPRPAVPNHAHLSPPLAAVHRRLGADPVHPDELALTLRLPAKVLAARLAELELAGMVRAVPGGLVVREPTAGRHGHTGLVHPPVPRTGAAPPAGSAGVG